MKGTKEKETDYSVSLSSGCSYAPAMVPLVGLEPTRYRYHRILSPSVLIFINKNAICTLF